MGTVSGPVCSLEPWGWHTHLWCFLREVGALCSTQEVLAFLVCTGHPPPQGQGLLWPPSGGPAALGGCGGLSLWSGAPPEGSWWSVSLVGWPLELLRMIWAWWRTDSFEKTLMLGVEAALSWLQFPQQDTDNIEKKPKVHLEMEVQASGRSDPNGLG